MSVLTELFVVHGHDTHTQHRWVLSVNGSGLYRTLGEAQALAEERNTEAVKWQNGVTYTVGKVMLP